MKPTFYFFFSLLLLIFTNSCTVKDTHKSDNEKNYIFFIHNKFLEDNPDGTFDKEYSVTTDYKGVISSFKNDGFVVLSEKRPPKTNGIKYAEKVVKQIDSLISKGVQPNHITVVGTSKGGYIAQFVSTFAKNPELNFVFIGCFQDTDIAEFPTINFCGNILTIYEKSDVFGVTAIKRKETSNLKINQFKEIELNTGLKHGFLYIASDQWIKPSKMWAKRNYELTE
ncbi:hypothetical protein J2X31_002189 [Flavobacterium arsenatis]|uniref:Alpha/beta hydrolase n=1 Tax=Flavobacterium arsenatis TaxID=1484332 RepID=A0ABU1TQD9_9FLAO|nr:alpha/beta hydrolase [Flavobacterium arsenatis]MDR6968174.1 hypothetical protein [Flavobacterium arsenatis]